MCFLCVDCQNETKQTAQSDRTAQHSSKHTEGGQLKDLSALLPLSLLTPFHELKEQSAGESIVNSDQISLSLHFPWRLSWPDRHRWDLTVNSRADALRVIDTPAGRRAPAQHLILPCQV